MTATRVIVEDAPTDERIDARDESAGTPTGGASRRTVGSLVCVAGTLGGAGTTTVSILLALHAATTTRPVLCVDAAGPTTDLARLAGAGSPHSLAETARALERGQLVRTALFANAPGGVRVIACDGRLEPNAAGVADLLSLARDAHGLCVVDGGVLASAASLAAYEVASHVVWVIPGIPSGWERAVRTLGAIGRHPTAREVVVARGCDRALGRVRPRELQKLASERHSPLIALPWVEKLQLPQDRERGLEECRTGLHELCRLTIGARAR
jgi:hypothetical protein